MSGCKPGLPDYYLYKKDGRWYKTDVNLTKIINKRFQGIMTDELPRVEFIPNWNKKDAQNAKYVAWKINYDGIPVIRWYWKVRDHKKTCQRCYRLDEGRCAVKVAAMIQWDSVSNYWTLAPMEYKATDEEAQILNKASRR